MGDRRLTDDELTQAIAFCEQGLIERPLLALRTSLDDGMSEALLGVLRELRDLRVYVEPNRLATETNARWRTEAAQRETAALNECQRLRAEVERLAMELRCAQIQAEDRGASYQESRSEADRLRALCNEACRLASVALNRLSLIEHAADWNGEQDRVLAIRSEVNRG